MNNELTPSQQKWLSHIIAADKSGLSYSAYAKQHGVSVDALFNAKYTLQKKGVLPSSPPKKNFVKAEAQSQPPVPLVNKSSSIEITLPNGIHLSIAADRALIVDLTQALYQL